MSKLTETSRIIEMAWEDRTPFDAIYDAYGINEREVKVLMKSELRTSSYRLWRKRVTGRKTKHTSCLLYTSPSPRDE